jgi:hypothetical protein
MGGTASRCRHAAARSSLSAPRTMIFRASSGNGRCNAFASSHGARRHRALLRSSGSPAWLRDGSARLSPSARSSGAVHEVRAGNRFGLCTAVTREFGPDPTEREQRSIIAKREPNDVLLFRFWVGHREGAFGTIQRRGLCVMPTRATKMRLHVPMPTGSICRA